MTFSVEHVSYSYRGREVLSDISFSIEKGELMTIMGPNGVGKTTLLRNIMGILQGGAGSIVLDGRDITRISPRERARIMSYVPQRSQVSGSTVFESVLLGRRPYLTWDVSEEDLDTVDSMISEIGLEDISEKKVDSISGGEYQLVQIARALVQEPKVIMLDEPTNNLDVANQESVMKILTGLIQERGLCAIMTNHDINLSARHSDRILMLKDGRCYATGGKGIITSAAIKDVYGMDVDVEIYNGNPMIIPV